MGSNISTTITNKLTAEQLRTGNVLFYLSDEGALFDRIDWQDIKWCTERNEDFNKYFLPIELTEEILIKAGFEWSVQHQAFRNVKYKWVIVDGYVYQNVRGGFFLCKIDYLHQLQNLIFTIEGRELEIKL